MDEKKRKVIDIVLYCIIALLVIVIVVLSFVISSLNSNVKSLQKKTDDLTNSQISLIL